MITKTKPTPQIRARYEPAVAALAAYVLVASGCATIEQDEVTEGEQMLSAAGFQQRLADTPEIMAHLQTLPQQDVTGHKEGDKPRYIYADATYCRCLYIGDDAAYQRYRQLERKSSQIDRQRQQTMWNHTSRMRWDVWGNY
jgi:hypothetical protein